MERHHCGQHNLLHDGPDCPRCTPLGRDDGFYWVKRGDHWQVAEWDGQAGWWWLCGNDCPFVDPDTEDAGWAGIIHDIGYRLTPPT